MRLRLGGPIRPWQALARMNRSSHDSEKVKVAVLGAGSLGKEHVRIYSALAGRGVEFAGVYDIATETARRVAERHQARVFGSLEEAAAASDALSIVTPTTTHFEIA